MKRESIQMVSLTDGAACDVGCHLEFYCRYGLFEFMLWALSQSFFFFFFPTDWALNLADFLLSPAFPVRFIISAQS